MTVTKVRVHLNMAKHRFKTWISMIYPKKFLLISYPACDEDQKKKKRERILNLFDSGSLLRERWASIILLHSNIKIFFVLYKIPSCNGYSHCAVANWTLRPLTTTKILPFKRTFFYISTFDPNTSSWALYPIILQRLACPAS